MGKECQPDIKGAMEDDERYCFERLGIANARGNTARRLIELSPFPSLPELLSAPLGRARFLVVDLETTGMKPGRSRIIEVGAVEVDGFELGRELSSLVYPGTPVPAFISTLTGISTHMVIKAPRVEEVLPLLRRMLKGRVLVAHNLSFDRGFLDREWEKIWGEEIEAPSLCTVKLSRRVFPELPSHNLDALAGHLNIRTTGKGGKARHRALGDARTTAMALAKICRKLEQEGMAGTVGDVLKIQNKRRPKKSAAAAS